MTDRECVALLQGRVSLEAALQFEQILRPLLQVTWINDELHTRSVRRWELKRSRSRSLVDCSSFVVMEDLSLTSAFGYDRDFGAEGFGLVGRPEQVLGH